MATLMWQRDIQSDIDGVTSTYSSWDSCMSKAYCKWPAIVGIIIGSLIVLSLIWCLARCLCCGAECCCGCFRCCNSCCPSPRRRRQNDGYYQQPPPQPGYQPYPQYQSPAPPMYASGGLGYRGAPQTATFDAPAKKYNEDALPAMPSWSNATDRHVEEEIPQEDLEMEKLDHASAQQETLLPKQHPADNTDEYYNNTQHQDAAYAGDLGTMHASNPYQDYDQHQQFVPSPISTARNSAYPPTYHTVSPTSTMYEPAGQQRQWGGYAPSVAPPPSYRTAPPSVVNQPLPQQQQQQQTRQIGRKPVQGSWRDV